MNNQEYEQKKREYWEEFKRENLDGEVQWQPVSRYDVFCAAFDRAYALGEQESKQESKQETVISGWVARDYDGDVFLYQNEPDRNEIAWNGYMMHSLPIDSFPDLTWDDDPIEVEIIIKRNIQ